MTFRERVYQVVKSIPKGKVTTYGEVAGIIGSPRAARQVGFALRSLTIEETEVPWWRVINSKGYISINHGDGGVEKDIQRDLLKADGIEVGENYTIELADYLWHPS
jgi:methylated-DNA-protein-cysteine methyltransferase related protein